MNPAIPRHDPSQWPARMTRADVASVHQRSASWLRARVADGRYPRPDSDGRWGRDVVQRIAAGAIKDLDKSFERLQRLGRLPSAVSASGIALSAKDGIDGDVGP